MYTPKKVPSAVKLPDSARARIYPDLTDLTFKSALSKAAFCKYVSLAI